MQLAPPPTSPDVRALGANRAWWIAPGLLYVAYGGLEHRNGAVFTEEDAATGTELVATFTGGHSVYMIADIRNLRSTSREARHTRNQDEGSVVALLVGCSVTRMIASAYLGLNRPKQLTRVFSNAEKALNWLLRVRRDRNEEPVPA